jgi:hypothetical protein
MRDDSVRYNVTCTNPETIWEICLFGKTMGMRVSFVRYRWESVIKLKGRNDAKHTVMVF